jgi:hypothetical protein
MERNFLEISVMAFLAGIFLFTGAMWIAAGFDPLAIVMAATAAVIVGAVILALWASIVMDARRDRQRESERQYRYWMDRGEEMPKNRRVERLPVYRVNDDYFRPDMPEVLSSQHVELIERRRGPGGPSWYIVR